MTESAQPPLSSIPVDDLTPEQIEKEEFAFWQRLGELEDE